MAILLRDKLLYLGHPRSASSATSVTLCRIGGRRVGPNHSYVKAPGKEITVSTLRNPLDLLATWFHLSDYDEMLTFIDEYQHDKFTQDGRLYYLAKYCDEFLVYDRLTEDFNALLQRFKLGKTRIYRFNTTPNKRPWQSYYTPELEAYVRERFAEDFALYEAQRDSHGMQHLSSEIL